MGSKWRKILYESQPFPDNYTDASFLEELKKNVNTQLYDLRTVIHGSGVVSQQLSCICIFVCLFIYMHNNDVTPETMLLLSLVGFVVSVAIMRKLENTHVDLFSVVHISLLVFGVSPILQTLTITISTDTIYAMTTGMLLANILFHDYGAGVAIVSRAISLNTSMFAAVCLASRLPSSVHGYVTVMLAVQIFALFPDLRKAVKRWHHKADILMTELLVLIALLLLLPITLLGGLALVIAHLSITFLFPLWMIKLQRLKNNIHGPWDEAMIIR